MAGKTINQILEANGIETIWRPEHLGTAYLKYGEKEVKRENVDGIREFIRVHFDLDVKKLKSLCKCEELEQYKFDGSTMHSKKCKHYQMKG